MLSQMDWPFSRPALQAFPTCTWSATFSLVCRRYTFRRGFNSTYLAPHIKQYHHPWLVRCASVNMYPSWIMGKGTYSRSTLKVTRYTIVWSGCRLASWKNVLVQWFTSTIKWLYVFLQMRLWWRASVKKHKLADCLGVRTAIKMAAINFQFSTRKVKRCGTLINPLCSELLA